MKWNSSDSQERQGVAIAELIISKLNLIFREQVSNDVGVDAHIELVDEKTHVVTGQLIALQIKGGDSYLKEKTDSAYIYRGSLEHLDYWVSHCLPVFLVLVDTSHQKAYWGEITEKTVERLDAGWKVAIPFANQLYSNFVPALWQRVGLEANSSSFTVLSLKDTSNSSAKRYSASILARFPLSRLRVEAILRKAVTDIQKESYHRTDFLADLFRGRGADVISLYVAGNPIDVDNANWVCRAMWVNESLAPDARPYSIGGIDLGEGLEVVWNSNYADMDQFYSSLQINKQDFLTAANAFTTQVEAIVQELFGAENYFDSKKGFSPEFLIAKAGSIRTLFHESGNVGLPPFDCREVAARFQDVMALANNAFIYLVRMNSGETIKGGVEALLEWTLRDYRKNLEWLRYEVEKIT